MHVVQPGLCSLFIHVEWWSVLSYIGELQFRAAVRTCLCVCAVEHACVHMFLCPCFCMCQYVLCSSLQAPVPAQHTGFLSLDPVQTLVGRPLGLFLERGCLGQRASSST